MKKALSVLLAVLMFCSIFAVTASAADKPVTITISNWLEVEDATAGVFRDMLDGFMAANPDIKVESIAIPFSNYKDQVLIAAVAGNAADVIVGNSVMMAAFNGAGILAGLDDLATPEIVDDLFEGERAGGTYDGVLRAMPWTPHPIGIYYNKELYAKAGLDPEKAPETWDEMTEHARKIAALGKDESGNPIYGLGIATGKISHTGVCFNGILYTYGGQFLDENGIVTLNTPENLEAFNYIKTLCDEQVIPTGLNTADCRGLFAAGNIGIIFDGDMGRNAFRESSGLGAAFDEKMGFAVMPAGKTGRSETVYTEPQLAVYEQSEQKEAAMKLVEYLVSEEAMFMYHKNNGVLSPRASIAALPEMNEDHFMEVFNKQSETASALPASNALFDNAMDEVRKCIERIVLNGEDVETCVVETEQIIRNLYGQ